MKTIEYNKLIRDKTPEIIEKAGKQAIVGQVQEIYLEDFGKIRKDKRDKGVI